MLWSPLVLAALLAVAPSKGKPGESRLQMGQSEFSRGNFDTALRDFDAALGEAADAMTLARIQLLRAQAFGAKQDVAQVEAAMAEALEFDPESSLDPARVDPGLVKVLESLRGRLKGELRISADRPGLRISLDGAVVGEAPLKVDATVGRHTVEALSGDGRYASRQQTLVHPKTGGSVHLLTVEVGSAASAAELAKKDDRPFYPFAEIRLDDDPSDAAKQFGFGMGGGIKSKFWRASILARLYSVFGLQVHGAIVVPLMDKLDGYAAVAVPFDFSPSGDVFVSASGAGGAEFQPSPWLGLFMEMGARHYFNGVVENRFILQAGVRLWLPPGAL